MRAAPPGGPERLGAVVPPGQSSATAARSAVSAASTRVRRLSIRAQLAMFSVLLVLVAAGGSSVAGWQIVDGLIQQGTTDRLNGAAGTFASLYNQRAADAEIVTRQLSERATLPQLIGRRASDQITSIIEPVQTLRPNYAIIVADPDGNVLAKLIPPGRPDPGPSIAEVPGVTEAVQLGAPLSPILIRRPDCQMVVAVSAPVRISNGTVVGVVHLRFPVDDELVRQIKADTGLEMSLFCGDQLVATALPGQVVNAGAKADPSVAQHVLVEGSDWEENLRAGDQTYRTRYIPLLDVEGKPVGMYSVSTPIQSLRDARNAILRYFLPVMACIALLGVGLGYLGSGVLTGPLRRLAVAAARIGSGDLESPVEAEGEDEVAQLAERMEEMRRSLYQTYTRLRELNQLKDEYLFSVAHEVRTPLASLVASVEILSTDYEHMPPSVMASTVRRIERAAVRLHTLVENVLDAGSIRAGRFSIYPEAVDLRQVLDGAVGTLQPLFEEKSQRLEIESADDLPAVQADERRVGQVFANLLSNASKYGPEGDTIQIRMVLQDDHVLASVTDHGPGIPLPEQGELFERYFRAASSARSSPGTGLGLAIAKAIVEAHGGNVGLECEPGAGTSIWFTLPLATQPERIPERQTVAA